MVVNVPYLKNNGKPSQLENIGRSEMSIGPLNMYHKVIANVSTIQRLATAENGTKCFIFRISPNAIHGMTVTAI